MSSHHRPAVNPHFWFQILDVGSGPRITSNIVDVSDAFKRKPSLLLALGAGAYIIRAGQSKRVHLVISGSGGRLR
jgi:hypothetical protein